MNKKLLITGALGFIGAHLIEGVLHDTDWDIVILDCYSYAGNFNRLADMSCWDSEKHRVKMVYHDLKSPISETTHKMIGEVNYIWHLAAESDVGRSLEDSIPFVKNNVVGTANLLEYVKHNQPKLERFIYFSCYDEKTRAFTKDGLKTYKELRKGDIVFTLNPKTKKVEEQPIERVIIQDYKGEMIRFNNGIIDLLTTPNHRIYQSDMSVLEAEDCIGKKISFPVSTGFNGKEMDMSKDLMYLIGVFLGDGFTAYQEKEVISNRIQKRNKKTGRFYGEKSESHKTKSKSWRVFLDIPENDKAREKTERVLTNLGIKFTKQKGKAGEHLYFTSEKWVRFFNQFGKGAKNKYIPEEFLQYNKEYLQELFNGLIDSDGYWGTRSYTTISDKLADGICEVAIKIGYIPNKQRRYSESIFENRVIKGYSWQINFANKRKTINPKFITKENYEGKIWCVQVKNKNFLVERNGKFTFSGNTDEVFGPAPQDVFYKEGDTQNPSNPYSASKEGAEAVAKSFAFSFGLPLTITRTMNVFGERQHPEKFVPMVIKRILEGSKVIIHGVKGTTDISSRCWIHAREVCNALLFLNKHGEFISKEHQNDNGYGAYHIVGEEENAFNIANKISMVINNRELKDNEIEWVNFHAVRPGHDLRYSLSGDKLKKMGFDYSYTLDESFGRMVRWCIQSENKKWLNL